MRRPPIPRFVCLVSGAPLHFPEEIRPSFPLFSLPDVILLFSLSLSVSLSPAMGKTDEKIVTKKERSSPPRRVVASPSSPLFSFFFPGGGGSSNWSWVIRIVFSSSLSPSAALGFRSLPSVLTGSSSGGEGDGGFVRSFVGVPRLNYLSHKASPQSCPPLPTLSTLPSSHSVGGPTAMISDSLSVSQVLCASSAWQVIHADTQYSK